MPPSEFAPLWQRLSASGLSDRWLADAGALVPVTALARGSSLGVPAAELRGRSVLLATEDQLSAALALIELDGVARRIVLCPPDLPPEHLASVAATAEADAVVTDKPRPELRHLFAIPAQAGIHGSDARAADKWVPACAGMTRKTEWVLLTSGTTGAPKLVAHTLASLAGAIAGNGAFGTDAVWSTFYDIRRYGGLQIFLRALLGGGSMVLSSAREPVGEFLVRAGRHGVTHISGTPSHWRRALMSPARNAMAPRYVRLSGEIADQAILDSLRAAYPNADLAHAFASTEAGVAFDVGDGLAGFPAILLPRTPAGVELRVANGSLRIRSSRTARGYLGGAAFPRDPDGFVDTGDMVELHDGRYRFVGRRGGIINIGGQKVHPEEVEAVINRHPGVRMSLVTARRNPITGAIVVADVVVEGGAPARGDALKSEILAACRDRLERHKVPAAIRFVPALEVAGSGKLARA